MSRDWHSLAIACFCAGFICGAIFVLVLGE